MRWLELKIPPIAVFLLVVALMALAPRQMPHLGLDWPFAPVLAAFLSLAGGVIAVLGFLEFRRMRTTIDPTRPQNAVTFVTSGIFRYSRNPMYLGLAFALLALAFWESHPLPFLGVPTFVLYMNFFQIRAEERALAEKFGDQYLSYLRCVRRWL